MALALTSMLLRLCAYGCGNFDYTACSGKRVQLCNIYLCVLVQRLAAYQCYPSRPTDE